MIATLAHRGPDNTGIYIADGVGLAHARLSIIDLQLGDQPMSTTDGRFWITFNGEIFNHVELRQELMRKGHKFVTHSDTEVILQLYRELGEDCVHHFNGQWAFAIWDSLTGKLFLSRDRLGVRPLFYTRTADSFLFASEIKALFAYPGVDRVLDLRALDQIFTFWTTLPSNTAFRGVQQLPPGHSLILEAGRMSLRQYWRLEYRDSGASSASCTSKAGEDLLQLLLDATRIRLRSDVPVGAYLSGGIDSTVTAALIARISPARLRTFSVSFEDPEFDESAYQREASAFLKTRHTEVCCRCDDIAEVFPEVIWHAEQPIVRTAPAPLFLLSRHVRDSGFKVVLTGEGADEMLGGYDIFKETKIRLFWARQPQSAIRPLLLRRLYPYMENIQRQPPAYLAAFFNVQPEDAISPFFSHLPRWQLTAKLKMFFSPAVRAEIGAYDCLHELEQALPSNFWNWTPFNRAEYLEAGYLLPGYILSSQGDRIAMAHSVEGRYPFLDHRVVEFASRLPASLKMKVLDQKYVLKRAVEGLIPTFIQHRPKQPYRAPDGKSFIGATTQDYVSELLSPQRIQRDGIFAPQPVAALVAKFQKRQAIGTKDNMALIGILSTQLVLDRFINHAMQGDDHGTKYQDASTQLRNNHISVWAAR